MSVIFFYLCKKMFNEIIILQIINFFLLIFFINSVNIITLWYLAGLYLMSLGFLLLVDDSDIFVGFLWVIDLGVGLIFFIFILHFSNFLHQKSFVDLSSRFFIFFYFFLFFIFFYFFLFSNPENGNYNNYLKKNLFFFLSWYNYYLFFYSYTITELNLLREIYFYNNSFEFFLINFMLFYGIFASINICFFIKRIFLFLNASQLINFNFLGEINSIFFIRNQNFIRQQNTSTGTRVWTKNKLSNLRDF
jgi:hypothetical protein